MKALKRSSLQRRRFRWTKAAKSVAAQKPALLLSPGSSRLLQAPGPGGADLAVLREAPGCGVLLFLYSHFSTLWLGPSLA